MTARSAFAPKLHGVSVAELPEGNLSAGSPTEVAFDTLDEFRHARLTSGQVVRVGQHLHLLPVVSNAGEGILEVSHRLREELPFGLACAVDSISDVEGDASRTGV